MTYLLELNLVLFGMRERYQIPLLLKDRLQSFNQSKTRYLSKICLVLHQTKYRPLSQANYVIDSEKRHNRWNSLVIGRYTQMKILYHGLDIEIFEGPSKKNLLFKHVISLRKNINSLGQGELPDIYFLMSY